jgi:spermidine/putrescine transport system substrate-binding protein
MDVLFKLMNHILALIALALVGCAATPSAMPTVTPQLLADEISLYNWVEYMPQSVLDAFTAEYGVRVNYIIYETQEEAVENVRAGLEYDVVILPPESIPQLIRDGRLAEIDYRNVPNFRNISANFRDLSYDPGNRYSILFHWGTTGLLVRTDLVDKPVTRWADLWDPAFAGRVGLWPIARDLIPISLKSLGYGANSVDPDELEIALQHLLRLKPNAVWWSNDNGTIVPALVSGEVVIAYGWAYDAQVAQEESVPISYILPEEGTFLWSDNFVIPASSKNKTTAELFLNFVLRPEISAAIVNESYYPMANEAAEPLIDPDILNDPVIYPSNEQLKSAEIIVPLGVDGENLFISIWGRFMEAGE